MKRRKKALGLSLVLIISLLITGCGKTAKLKTSDTTAVKVKGATITATQFYNELKKDSISTLVNMIDHKLFDKKYPTNEEEEQEIEKQISSIKSYYKDDENSYLSAIKTYYNVESEDELKELLSLQYKRKQAVNDYVEKKITNKEIQKYYDENVYADVKASHILISVETTDKMSDEEKEEVKEKAKKKAEKIITKLNNGEDFSKLAKKYSDDDATASKGGDLGYFNSDDMDSGFWNGVQQLAKDEYSKEPVESSYGYHIILKTGEKKKKSLKKMKSEIKEKIREDKLNNDSTLYYKTLKSIREDKNITFGDSNLEKQYNEYMDNLINSSNSSQEQ